MSSVSHEINTPLTVIDGTLYFILTAYNDKLEDKVRDLLEMTKAGVNRLKNFVKDMNSAIAVEINQVKLQMETTDLISITQDILKKLHPLIVNNKVKINTHFQDRLYCNADREKVGKVIEHLIINAIKFSGNNATVNIEIQQYSNNFIKFSIEDDGVGISKEDFPKLFTKFGKIDSHETKKIPDIQGAGLGLFYSKNVIELHKGKIWAESEGPNKGAQFSFMLPLLKNNLMNQSK